MAEADRIAAALAYQEQMPATLNPNLARQGARGRANMMPPTSIMDERYPAFKRNQEDVEKLMLGVDLVGSAIPLAGPAMKGAKVLGQHAAPQLAQALENYAFKTGMALPMDVWHGSPHRFAPTAKNPLGEFNPTKIGTGEGAQAYGYGHYLAESPNVGAQYKLSTSANQYDTAKGTIRSSDLVGELFKSSGNVPKNLESAYRAKANEVVRDLIMGKSSKEIADQIKASNYANIYKGLINAVENLSPQKTTGSLYKVDLPDEAVSRMLDFDKHLAEQSPQVQKILSDYQKELGTSFGRGDQVLKEIAFDRRMKGLDDSPAAVANQLKELGIPGIQFLDAASRGAGTGTRNFVVFPGNEGLLNILGRE